VDGYLDRVRVSLGEDEYGRGPTGMALKKGLHVVCNDIAGDPRMAPWRAAALALDFRASAAFPIRIGGQVRGAFSLYADSAGFFTEEELRLLDDLAQDIGFALDFIETGKARDTLNRRMMDLLDTMSDGFVSVDRDWRYRYVNRRAGEIVGRAASELVGTHVWTEFPASVGRPIHVACERVMKEGVMLSLEEYYPPWDRWFENRIYPTQDGISIFFTDVSERKRREEELKRLHSTLNALVEGSTDAIFVKDLAGRYVVVNRALANLLGRPVEELIGAEDHALFPAELAERCRADDQRIMAAGMAETCEESVVTSQGAFSHLTTKGPLVIDGEVRGVFGISRDITERKRAETELRRQRDLLDRTGRLAQVGGWEFDVETGQGSWTDETARIHDLEPGPASLAQGLDCFRGESRRILDQAVLEAIRTGQPYDLELESVSAKGVRKWVRTIGLPVRENGRVVRMEGAIQDITGRKLAETQARQGKLVLDSVFQALPDLFFLMDADGTIRDYRARKTDDLYVPSEAFLGKRMQDVLPAKLGEQFLRMVAEVGEQGGLLTHEYDLPMPDGTRHFEARLTRLPDGTQVIAVIRDITREYLDRLALSASEVRYRSLLEMAPFPAVLSRLRDGILLYGNRRAEIQFGLSRDQGVGQPADRFYEAPSERARFVALMQRDGQVDDLEVRMRGVDGRCFWALVSASMVEFENEPAIFAAINDITARKRMEVALREQEEFFRLIAENMGDMVAVLDLDGRRLYNSPSYGALFGDITALKGTDSFAEIHPDDRARVRQVFRETIATGCGQRATFRFVLPDGGVREMESQGGVIRGPDGQVERVVVVSRDITERRRMEDEIRQLNADLEARVRARTSELAAANKELETFTYSVSHDLKAPLRGIDGYSRLLLEGHLDRLDEEGRMFLGNVRRGVDQMSQLIEDLLAYSRMERRDLHGMSLDLARQVDMALAERREDIQVSGMLVRVDVEPLVVQADPDGLAMVLRNLIDNALKFSRDSRPPTLTISATPGEGNVILTIRDNGIGFDMRFQERIFEIFQRLQRAEDYPGTGVGLAIVRKAMQRMGGQVRVESSPGQGAAFHLELPR
jgi:PAS domain S-box-containing protein